MMEEHEFEEEEEEEEDDSTSSFPRVEEQGEYRVSPTTVRKVVKKTKVALLMGYSGTGYAGMQYQHGNHRTIEDELVTILRNLGYIDEEATMGYNGVFLSRSARTDKGVHAVGQCVGIQLRIKKTQQDKDLFLQRVNEALPKQIRVYNLVFTQRRFDPRRICGKRRYEYLVPAFMFTPQPDIWAAVSRLYNEKLREIRLHAGAIGEEDDDSFGFKRDYTFEELRNLYNTSWSGQARAFCESKRAELIQAFGMPSYVHQNGYKLDPNTLALFNRTLKLYEGTHNFINFTDKGEMDNRQMERYMIKVEAGEPEIVNGVQVIRVVLLGQSFIYNQIRNMIGFAIEIARRGLDPELILPKALDGNYFCYTPLAPAEGLLLDAALFDTYNEHLTETSEKGDNDDDDDDDSNHSENDHNKEDHNIHDKRIDFDSPFVANQMISLKRNIIYPAMMNPESFKVFETFVAQNDFLVFPRFCGYTLRSNKYLESVNDRFIQKRRAEITHNIQEMRNFLKRAYLGRPEYYSYQINEEEIQNEQKLFSQNKLFESKSKN